MQMDAAFHTPLQSVETPLLAVLSRTDLGVWCYIALDQNAALRCSEGFRRLWHFGGGAELGDTDRIENRQWLTQSLHHFGINPCLFFDLIANVSSESATSDHCTLVRNDQRQLTVTIVPVIQQNLIRGHLVRMSDVVQSSFVDAMLQTVNDARQQLKVLSQREAEILELVYAGRTNKAISITTTISEKTVEKHRARIMQKLSLSSTSELIRLVTRARLIDELTQMSHGGPANSGMAPGLYKGGRLRESA